MFHQNNSTTMIRHSTTKSLISTNDSNKKIKNLLLQGWRNRWTAPQFTIYLKQQLSIVSISGDTYELSKLILQQATVSRQPVILFIDYLHHLLSCGVVSFGSVINSIIETCKKENTQVVICLLDFLLNQENNINCFSNEQDCLNLATSLARLIRFIFNCLEYSLQQLNELISNQFRNQWIQHEQAIEKCSNLLLMIKNSQMLISLIYIGLIEENQTRNQNQSINFNDVYDLKEKLSSKLPNIENLNSSLQNVYQFIQTLFRFNPNLQAKKYLQFKNEFFNYRKSSNPNTINESSIINDQTDQLNKALISLNCVVTIDAILNSKAPSSKLANQLIYIATINHLKFSTICCELIRCSFVNFADSLDQDKEQISTVEMKFSNQFQHKSTDNRLIKENFKWASFIYFKLPLVLKSLKQLLKIKFNNQSLELEGGLEKLINYTPLIELIDYKSDSDCLGNFLSKLNKLGLISETFQKTILKKKEDKIEYFNNLNAKIEKDLFKKEKDTVVMIQGHILLKKVESTVDSILYSLNKEIAVKSDHVIQVFSKVITGNSIEIVVTTTTFNGKLNELVKKIIHFNEINIHGTVGEDSKQAALRANLFDISFLILFFLIQEHGQETILNCLEEEGIDLNSARNSDEMEIDDKPSDHQNHQLANSFFVKFCLDYMPENLAKVNYDEKLSKTVDSNKIDSLLTFFSTENFNYQLIKWNEVLLNAIGVFKELLHAYLYNYLKFEDLTTYLHNMIKRNCSILLVIAFYAINHLRTVHLDHQKKIMAVLNFLNSTNFSSNYSNQSELTHSKEKHTLTLRILRSLMDEKIPKKLRENQLQSSSLNQLGNDHQINEFKENELNNSEIGQIEMYKVLRTAFLDTIKRGWLSTNSIYCFNRVLCISGATWFMDKLIKLLLYECDAENLFEGVELVYGLSTLDMEQCCLALLNIVIPQYLISDFDKSILIEPKLNALSKLLSSIMYTVLESDMESKTTHPLITIESIINRNSSYYIEDNFIQYEDKLIISEQIRNKSDNAQQQQQQQIVNGSAIPIQFITNQPNIDKRKELLFDSIAKLLRLVSLFLNESKVSQRTTFSLLLLEQLIYTFPCKGEHLSNQPIHDILKLISLGLNSDVQIILQYLPFDTQLNLIRIFPNKINYDLLLSIGNLKSSNSRMLIAKSICQLSRSRKKIDF